jgi:hypothetical protein
MHYSPTNIIALAVSVAIASSPAFALDKLHSPIVEKGEFAIEYSGDRTFDSDSTKDNVQGHEVEVEYGVTDFWSTSIAFGMGKNPGDDLRLEEAEWENRFQLAEQGKYWVDPGLLVSYIRARGFEASDAIEAKLLLQKDTGRFTHVANLGLEQEVGAHSEGGPDRSIIWSSRYRYDAHFEPGIEIQSGFGKANEHLGFDEQEHYAGPALYGQIVPGLNYQAAWLFGASEAAATSAARVLLEYEMHF